MLPLFESAPASPLRSLRVGGLGNLSVRHLGEADQAQVRALFARTAHELSESASEAIPTLASARERRAQGVSIGIFASIGPGVPSPRLLGIGGLCQAATSPGDATALSFALVVAPQVRGLGIGSELLRALLDEAARSGASLLVARTVPSNVAMLTIAQRAGLAHRRLFGAEPILLRATVTEAAPLPTDTHAQRASTQVA